MIYLEYYDLFRITELFINLLKCTNRKNTKQIIFDITEIISHSPQAFQAQSQGLGAKPATPIVAFTDKNTCQKGSFSHCSIF